jgi:hypothetical protein
LLFGKLLMTFSFLERHVVTPAAMARVSGNSGSATGLADGLPLMAWHAATSTSSAHRRWLPEA